MSGHQPIAWARRREIAEILAEEDLVTLAPGNPDIIDEYQPEADAIARQLIGSEASSTIAPIIQQVFKDYFEVECAPEDAQRIASRIASLLNTR